MKKLLYVLVAFAWCASGCGGGGGGGTGGGQGGSGVVTAVDAGALASLGRGYLRAAPYTRLIIEVDRVRGLNPTASALNHLQNIIAAYADKPNGISFAGETEFNSTQTNWTAADILAIANAVRNFATSGDAAVMHIIYLNGRFENQNALGVALNASTFAIFPERINDATSALVLAPQIERAVLVHEAGHLFGLVNITYQSQINHEDQQHPRHDTDQNCVMFWAIEDVSLTSILNLGPPADFTDACRQDMQLLKRE